MSFDPADYYHPEDEIDPRYKVGPYDIDSRTLIRSLTLLSVEQLFDVALAYTSNMFKDDRNIDVEYFAGQVSDALVRLVTCKNYMEKHGLGV